jgi:magnesium transporter
MVFGAEALHESEALSLEDFEGRDSPGQISWINLDGVHDAAPVEALGKRYHLHPLMLEDIMNTAQRPKQEEYGDYIFIVLKMLFIDSQSGQISSEQVCLVLGEHLLISFQEVAGDVFDPVRERIRKGRGRIRTAGADYLAYALADAIVDQYFAILENIGNRLEEIEAEILSDPTSETLQAMHELRGELILLRKQVWPTREVLNRLTQAESPLIQNATTIFFRDVYDHTIQVMEAIESYRDILTGMLDVYLSMIGHRTNEIMRVLTIMAAIFIPLTFIAGVYGMNFKYMPELAWPWGYPLIWLVMVAMGVGMVIYFKKKKWL